MDMSMCLRVVPMLVVVVVVVIVVVVVVLVLVVVVLVVMVQLEYGLGPTYGTPYGAVMRMTVNIQKIKGCCYPS